MILEWKGTWCEDNLQDSGGFISNKLCTNAWKLALLPLTGTLTSLQFLSSKFIAYKFASLLLLPTLRHGVFLRLGTDYAWSVYHSHFFKLIYFLMSLIGSLTLHHGFDHQTHVTSFNWVQCIEQGSGPSPSPRAGS